MEQEVIKTGTYQEFKSSLDSELKKATEGFVKIGYLLKIARDTNVLAESGYQTVAEFAKAEYGLSKDVVSRYIAINDRYSQGGYSEQLEEKYRDYGVAKLQEMLTLPDTVIESMTPDMTRKDIQTVKKEIQQEEQISDIEVMLEQKNEVQENMTSNLHRAMHQYLYDNREEYVAIHKVIKKQHAHEWVEGLLDILAPSGVAMKSIRLSGVGKLMLAIQGADVDLNLINIRENSKETYSWGNLCEVLCGMCKTDSAKKEWETIYGEVYEEEKPKVAPVQQEKPQAKEQTKTEIPKEPQLTQATKEEVNPPVEPQPVETKPAETKSVEMPIQDVPKETPQTPQQEVPKAAVQENTEVQGEAEPEEPQIPGQMRVEDYPELMPDAVTNELTEFIKQLIERLEGESYLTTNDAGETDELSVEVVELEDVKDVCRQLVEEYKGKV